MSESNQGNTIQRDKVENLSQGEPAWLKENRLVAWESYLQCPMPTSRDENWKSTTVDQIDLSKFWDKELEIKEDEFDVEKELKQIKKPVTKLGDIITLGKHRLICGDSTDPNVLKRLVGDRKSVV